METDYVVIYYIRIYIYLGFGFAVQSRITDHVSGSMMTVITVVLV